MNVIELTAVVNGAATPRGIGRATAHTLAATGWNLAVLDLDEAAVKATADEIGKEHSVHAVGDGVPGRLHHFVDTVGEFEGGHQMTLWRRDDGRSGVGARA
ncbi:SDR family oxidoreductase [Streptomyces sp. NPDC102360]|uniref:SDR family oxidoreductase n=1 Tax=Streptomyces sp. NPDC102360 TaxID=3366160 RepID=UPI0038304263